MEREYKKFARGKLGRAERWIDTLAKFHQTTPRDKKSRTTGRETMRSADRSCTVSKEIIVIAEFENWAKLGFLSISKGFFQIVRLSFRKFNLNLLQINLHVVNSEFGERVRGWKLDHDD